MIEDSIQHADYILEKNNDKLCIKNHTEKMLNHNVQKTDIFFVCKLM